jgi:arylsulfatase A-like enzyme
MLSSTRQWSQSGNSGPLNGGKQDTLEGGIRSPMFVVWSEKTTSGQHSDAPTMTKDVYPTRCALTGAPHDRNFDGVSLLPVLLGEGSVDPERTMIWVGREGGPHGGQEYYTIRRGRWKLVQKGPFEPLRLYNLDDDPGEGAHLPEDHEKYRELFAALRDHVLRALPWQRRELG